jgi:hypothetical protein
MFNLIGPHVRHFSDRNQTVCPTSKNKPWLPIIPKQREWCLVDSFKIYMFILVLTCHSLFNDPWTDDTDF